MVSAALGVAGDVREARSHAADAERIPGMNDPRIIPADYDQLQKWFNLIRRMQSTVTTGASLFIEVGVFIDEAGIPRKWTSPKVSRLEPKNGEVKLSD